MTARVAQFGISSQQTPTFCCSTEGRHLGWLERHGSPIPHLPLGSRDSADRGEGSHLLARFDRGTSAGGTSARGAFAHPLEHVGQVPAGVPGSAQWWWALAPCSALSGWKDRTQRGAVGGAVKSSSWEAPPRTQVSSSSGRDGGTSEKMTRKTSSGWKEQRPRGRTGDLALARRTFGLSQPQPSSSFPAEGQRALQGGKGWEHDLEGVHCSH